MISSIYLFVESIFPFIIIIDYGRLQQSTDEGKRVYISWDCNRLNLSSHVCQVINYLEIEIMILIICFEELISTFNDKFRSMFLKNCVWKDILLMLVQCTFELNVPFPSFWRTAPLLSWGLLIEHQLQFNFWHWNSSFHHAWCIDYHSLQNFVPIKPVQQSMIVMMIYQ